MSRYTVRVIDAAAARRYVAVGAECRRAVLGHDMASAWRTYCNAIDARWPGLMQPASCYDIRRDA